MRSFAANADGTRAKSSRLVTDPQQPVPIPPLALRVADAAAAIGLSESAFRREVLPHVRSVKVGKARVVAVVELERWLYLNGRLVDEE